MAEVAENCGGGQPSFARPVPVRDPDPHKSESAEQGERKTAGFSTRRRIRSGSLEMTKDLSGRDLSGRWFILHGRTELNLIK
jgi:hypothetical protein